MVVAATGFFDGFHLGHQQVIRTLLEYSRKGDGQSLVITLWPHPRVFLQDGARDLRLLTSLEEKTALLKAAGIDDVQVLPFTADFASLDARSYLSMLQDKFAVSGIVLGYDNRFGSDGKTTGEIALDAESLGIEAVIVPPIDVEGLRVSSSQIRKCLAGGEVELASKMLGRDYSLCGVVVGGKRMGRTIGFPTANLRLREPLKCIPGVGVYLSEVTVQGDRYMGMTNVDASTLVETHIFDFDRDIYGLDIDVTFKCKIRDEIRFSSFEQLKNQLKKDEMSAKNLIFAKYDHKERRREGT